LLGELEGGGKVVICDLEAGVGSVVRAGQADLVLAVAEPSVKSIDVAKRAIASATHNGADVLIVANRIREDADVEKIREALGDHELVTIPDDPAIARADQEGRAPIDVDPDSPGVRAIAALAERLAANGHPVTDGHLATGAPS